MRIVIVLMLCMVPLALAEQESTLEIGQFSSSPEGTTIPTGWKPLTFKKIAQHTQYQVVKEGGTLVMRAISEAAASGLTKEVQIDPREYSVVRWRWKVENLLKHSDVHRKDGDDYPARLYITFAYDADKMSFAKKLKYQAGRVLFGDIPIAALNYIWEATTPIGTIVDNVYTDFARMIVVESGPTRIGQWLNEERNVYDDYKRAFAGEPPMINGVAIMSDTDNTGERVTAFYGDITFVKR